MRQFAPVTAIVTPLVGNRLVHVRICAQGKVIAECGTALNLHINCASVYRDNYRMALVCVTLPLASVHLPSAINSDVIAVGISLYLILHGIGLRDEAALNV